jgi:hypothetical protein
MIRASNFGVCLKLAFVVALMVVTSYAWASEAVVTTHEGRTLTGELVSEDSSTVTLLISGIKTPIPRTSIQSVEIMAEPQEQYKQMRSELEDDDFEGRYRLAYTMFEKKWYGLAMSELQSLERAFPDNNKTRSLQTVVQSRIDRARDSAPANVSTADRSQRDPVTVVTQAPGGDQLLTEEQINLIRIYEVDLDTQPRVTLTPETIEKLFKTYASDDRLDKDRREFQRMPGHEKLDVLFTLQARELYGEVIIQQDSPAIKAFRSQLHQRYVLNYCAATSCHGDKSPGGLFLFRIQPNSDATVYTNFYILNRMEKSQGALIDRDMPRRSLLLQYGLNRDAAATPHPDVPGWRQQFVNEQDQRFEQYVDVINQLWKPAPNYGISYRPPVWQDDAASEQDADAAAIE